MELLTRVSWTFSQEKYEDFQSFLKEIEQRNAEIMEENSVWNADDIVLQNATIDIQYMAWLASEKDLLSNEELCEDDDFWDNEDNSDDGYFQAELLMHLKADNGSNFTAGELLFKIHNQLANKELGDHMFFEGLQPYESDDNVPSYYLLCGS